jgi:hypothetical protein
MAEQVIARRKALKYLALLTASAAGREFLAGWLPRASAGPGPRDVVAVPGMHHAPPPSEPAGAYVPHFFKPEEFETVEVLTEMIIPTDDKPGAREAQVASYIDFVVFSAAEHEPDLPREWAGGLALLDRISKENYGRAFREIAAAERERLLMEMSLPERDASARHPGYSFYRLVKEMTVEGFYSSRVGLIDVLEYQGLAYLSEFPGCTHPEHQ